MSQAPFEDGAFEPRALIELIGQLGHHGAIGIQYGAHGEDWVEMALPYADTLIGVEETGVLASGPIISLMDVATSLSIWVRQKRFRPLATLDLRIDYLRPATPGKTIIGRGECYAIKRSISFVRGLAHEGDPADPVANVTGTFMFTD